MLIKLVENGKKHTFIVPLFIFKMKFVRHTIKKSIHFDFDIDNIYKPLYNELKRYVRKNGHFDLVEVTSKDTYVKIRF